QLNPTVGDIGGNLARIRRARDAAAAGGADLVVLPELALIGYPPEDLVLRPSVVDACHAAIDSLVRESHNAPALIATTPWREEGRVYNAAILIDKGATTRRFKCDLPNYGVFDEKRVFAAGPMPDPVNFRGIAIGVPVCEDIWTPAIVAHLARAGAEFFLVPNGSPFEIGKFPTRIELARARARETNLALAYVNQVGGQDELVFDGRSFVLNRSGALACSLTGWDEAVELTRWTRTDDGWTCAPGHVETMGDQRADTYSALMTGLRDYVDKNGFPGIVLGLSGGVDSALSAAIGVDALGSDRVLGVRLPSPFTGDVSMEEAQFTAERLGIRLVTLPIGEVMTSAEAALAPVFEGRPRDVAEENLQARIRGMLLMGLSNKFGSMLLTTGNKSEMSVGYATLYGDMCGGFSVLKDIYKTEVYRLSRWRNGNRPALAKGPARDVIPERTLTRPPTAELRPNQTDQDSLPPYDQLDAILMGLIEEEKSVDEIAAAVAPRAIVARVQQMLYTAEYKRRQAPPGVKVSRRSFGRDRRYPITNRYRELK
ncbi:MAG TPA: NAD+ synthase, partial [Vicinamibacterales bacterium]|nr:NAD+ synthase [Vicinamibacterales bacterium]